MSDGNEPDPQSSAVATRPESDVRVSVRFDPERHCGAKLRSGGRCRKTKGWGVPGRNGLGPCKLHGGMNGVANLKHGLYSRIRSPRLQSLMDQQDESGQDVLDLRPEAKLLRALTVDYIDRFEARDRALQLWHNTAGGGIEGLIESVANGEQGALADLVRTLRAALEDRPPQLPDLTAAGALVEKIGRTVERIEKLQSSRGVTVAQLKFIFQAQTNILSKHIDDKTMERILADFRRISWT